MTLKFLLRLAQGNLVSLAALSLAGCAVTTRSMEGTSETVQNTAEASTKLSSSTSPRSSDDDTKNGERPPKREGEPDVEAARDFLRSNLPQVREDAARGEGDYLDTVGLMLGVLRARLPEFEHLARTNYLELFGDEDASPEQVTQTLNESIRRYPWLRRAPRSS